MQPISIVYEEPHFLIADKPAALFSQAPQGVASLQSCLVAQLKQRDQHPGAPFVGLPHRLDRGTSGIMLIARNQRALKRFGEQFQSRKVIKHYLAVVEGDFTAAIASSDLAGCELRWEDYLRKIPDQPRAEVVPAGTPGAKLAVASVQMLGCSSGQSLLCIRLETGRMHQIRVQAASRGFPVVGDASYGAKLPWKTADEFREASAVAETHAGSGTDTLGDAGSECTPAITQPAGAQQFGPSQAGSEQPSLESHAHPPVALHAWSLEFRHPQTAKAMRFTVPVPANWQQLPADLFSRCTADVTKLLPSSFVGF